MKREVIIVWSLMTVVLANHHGDLYTNPVVDNNRPDPGVLQLPGGTLGFVLVSTSDLAVKGRDPAFPIMVSNNLVDWTDASFVFSPDTWPKWAQGDMWAPEIRLVNDRYHVYYSARRSFDGQMAIGVAISKTSSPLGPYKDYGRPIITGYPGVIDVHYFMDPKTKKTYLLWKYEYNSIDMPAKIFMRQVNRDGVTFKPDSPTITMIRATDPSDDLTVEAESLIYRKGFYYIFFSSYGFENVNYHVSVARSRSIDGPYERFPGEFFLHLDYVKYVNSQNCTFVGPGGGMALQVGPDIQDEWWYVYHAWIYGSVGQHPPGRVLNIDKIQWDDKMHWPFIGIPSDTPKKKPNIVTPFFNDTIFILEHL